MTSFVQKLLAYDNVSTLPIIERTHSTIKFRKDADTVSHVLGPGRIHYFENGQVHEVDTDLVNYGSYYSAGGMAVRIFADGRVGWLDKQLLVKTVGVGMYLPATNNLTVLQLFNNDGVSSNNSLVREEGIYKHEILLDSRGHAKEELTIASKPDLSAGDYFVIATRVLSPGNFPVSTFNTGDRFEDIGFLAGNSWDADGNHIKNYQKAIQYNGNIYIVSGIPAAWLDQATYPVVIDPTYDWDTPGNETEVMDTYISDFSPTTNFGSATNIRIENNAATSRGIGLIRWPVRENVRWNATLTQVQISVYIDPNYLVSDGKLQCHPLLRNWVESEATWEVYSTGNSWGSDGANTSGTDYQAIGTIGETNHDVGAATGWDTTTFLSGALFDGWQDHIDGTLTNYGWRYYNTSAWENHDYYIHSSGGTNSHYANLEYTSLVPRATSRIRRL